MGLLSDVPVHVVKPSVVTGPPTVVVRGPLDLATIARVRAVIEDVLGARPSHLVVDLSDCPSVDASALAMLLEVHRRMARSGGCLTLRGAGPRVVRVLSLTGLRRVFDLD